jgi:MerR family transcriptional regulator, mercuric resistance operon regulatory protein
MKQAPQGFTIGRLAVLSRVNLETIRYYERIALMPAPARTQGGHRLYDEGHERRLSFIKRARELGFGINSIRALLDLAEPGQRLCKDVVPIAAAHLAEVRAKIADLVLLERTLAETVSRCARDATAKSCPMLKLRRASSYRWLVPAAKAQGVIRSVADH